MSVLHFGVQAYLHSKSVIKSIKIASSVKIIFFAISISTVELLCLSLPLHLCVIIDFFFTIISVLV